MVDTGHGPSAVKEYANGPETVGVPDIVYTRPLSVQFTPAGSEPVSVHPVDEPPLVKSIWVIALLIQTVGLALPADNTSVLASFTVIVPAADGTRHGPVVFTVYGNIPNTVGVPLMVICPALKVPVTPAGRPVTEPPVALPPVE